jgi:pimeloyl-ACP methyl ester carboxylesterase
MRAGFAHAPDFWQQLWWTVLADVPVGLEKIDCPVILAQGAGDVMASVQTLATSHSSPDPASNP